MVKILSVRHVEGSGHLVEIDSREGGEILSKGASADVFDESIDVISEAEVEAELGNDLIQDAHASAVLRLIEGLGKLEHLRLLFEELAELRVGKDASIELIAIEFSETEESGIFGDIVDSDGLVDGRRQLLSLNFDEATSGELELAIVEVGERSPALELIGKGGLQVGLLLSARDVSQQLRVARKLKAGTSLANVHVSVMGGCRAVISHARIGSQRRSIVATSKVEITHFTRRHAHIILQRKNSGLKPDERGEAQKDETKICQERNEKRAARN